MAPLLVIVADDAGVDVARNRGIVAGCAAGVIGAVSILATGTGLRDLASRLRDLDPARRPDLGIHVNLTEGRALTGRVAGATDGSGAFLDDKTAFWRAALDGRIDVDGVEREVEAQFERLAAAGLVPTRVDGHQHVHVVPGVRDAVARVTGRRDDVCWVRLGRPVPAPAAGASGFPRLPRERVASAWLGSHDAGRFAEAALGTLHDECQVLRDAGLRSTDLFAGTALLFRPGRETFFAELEVAVSEARDRGLRSIELMTHPGECDEGSVPFSGRPGRRTEQEALCAPDLQERIAELGLELGRFSDLERVVDAEPVA